MRGILLSGVVLMCMAALPPVQARADEGAVERVGLVLSGGGARGLAHVGVIRALEEYGVQVDVIVGTSMGAIVGGLRASGLDAEALERVARGTDWALAFTDRSPRQDQPYIFRQLDAGLAADYRLHIARGRIVLPRSVLKGQHMTAMLDDLFVAVDRVDDFDALPIPFRAVAADLVSGEQVVLDRGRLSTAVRASMSIPGLLEPVEMEGRLLVDGGVVNNIPVDVARSLGATRLLVVDVGTPRRQLEDIQSLVDVMDQLTGLMVRGNSDEQLASLGEQDLLIRPNWTRCPMPVSVRWKRRWRQVIERRWPRWRRRVGCRCRQRPNRRNSQRRSRWRLASRRSFILFVSTMTARWTTG